MFIGLLTVAFIRVRVLAPSGQLDIDVKGRVQRKASIGAAGCGLARESVFRVHAGTILILKLDCVSIYFQAGNVFFTLSITLFGLLFASLERLGHRKHLLSLGGTSPLAQRAGRGFGSILCGGVVGLNRELSIKVERVIITVIRGHHCSRGRSFLY